MKDEFSESELLFKIHRLKKDDDTWVPAIEDVTSHDVTPVWAAGLAYMIMDRYISCVKDSDQHKFYEEAIHWLSTMLKENKGSEYIDTIKPPDHLN